MERWRDLLLAKWGSRLYSSEYFWNSSIQSSNSLCLDKIYNSQIFKNPIHSMKDSSFLCRFFYLFICLPGWFPETLTCDFIMQFHKFCSPVLATNYHLVFAYFLVFFFIHFFVLNSITFYLFIFLHPERSYRTKDGDGYFIEML